jgi:type II pantothenate kinase
MILCGVDAGLSDTKYAYRTGGEIVFGNSKPVSDKFGYTVINAVSTPAFPEFDCVVAGAKTLTGLSEFLLLSMGTGTAFLRVKEDGYTHLGGSGLGGGTLKGLFALVDNTKTAKEIALLSQSGDKSKVDLLVGDVLDGGDSGGDLLMGDVTAANLFKLTKNSRPEDFAAGIVNLIAESLLMMAVFARRGNEKIVCVGGLSNLALLRQTAKTLGQMHKISFIFPDNSAFAGAIGCLINLEKISKENINDLS